LAQQEKGHKSAAGEKPKKDIGSDLEQYHHKTVRARGQWMLGNHAE